MLPISDLKVETQKSSTSSSFTWAHFQGMTLYSTPESVYLYLLCILFGIHISGITSENFSIKLLSSFCSWSMKNEFLCIERKEAWVMLFCDATKRLYTSWQNVVKAWHVACQTETNCGWTQLRDYQAGCHGLECVLRAVYLTLLCAIAGWHRLEGTFILTFRR